MKLNLGHRSDRYRDGAEPRRHGSVSNNNTRRQHKSRRLRANDTEPKTFDLLTPDQAAELIANSKPVPAKDLAKLAGKLGTVIVVVDDQED